MPPGLRRKSIAVGMRPAMIIAVVARAAGHRFDRQAGGFDCVGHERGEALIHGHRGLIHFHCVFELQAATCGDCVGLFEQLFGRDSPRFVVGVANVEAQAHRAGNHVAGVRLRFELAHGRDEAFGFERSGFDFRDPLGGGGERIAAQVHGRGAGVIGVADEGEIETALADDAGDRGDGEVFGFKHRALFDVELDEADGMVSGNRVSDAVRIEFAGFDGLTYRDAFRILQRKNCGIEAAGDCTASDEGEAEANAFFFREGDDFKREGQTEGAGGFDELKRENDAEHAVEGSGVGDGVDVGAENEALAGYVGRSEEAAQVADGVDGDGHAEGFHAGAQVLVNLANGRGEEAAGGAAGLFTHGGDGSAFGDDAFCAFGHLRTNSLPVGSLSNLPSRKMRRPRSQVSCTRPRRFAPR